MFELAMFLAFLVPAGLILWVVLRSSGRGSVQRGGTDESGLGSNTSGVTFAGMDTGAGQPRDDGVWSSGISGNSWDTGSGGNWDTGNSSSCDSGDGGGFSSGDSGGSSDGGGGGSCD